MESFDDHIEMVHIEKMDDINPFFRKIVAYETTLAGLGKNKGYCRNGSGLRYGFISAPTIPCAERTCELHQLIWKNEEESRKGLTKFLLKSDQLKFRKLDGEEITTIIDELKHNRIRFELEEGNLIILLRFQLLEIAKIKIP
ncbi:hypothetical protein BH09DEP1_BH09DEP1_2440 [soil metagenome]